MIFTNCRNQLPIIFNITQLTDLQLDSDITITGRGFSSISCENEVLVGGVLCPVISSTNQSLVCNLGLNSGLLPNIDYLFEVYIKNLGFALHKSLFRIKFQSIITSFLPSNGTFIFVLHINSLF